MNREVYTYTDLSRLASSRNMAELMKYPHITVSADLRKSLIGKKEVDRVEGIFSNVSNFYVSEFNAFSRAIDEEWNSDKCKFNAMIVLSEYVRLKYEATKEGSKERNWLTGCLRNLDSMLSSIILLEQACVKPEDFNTKDDRNLELLVGAWKNLIEKNPSINRFRNKMASMTNKEAWRNVFKIALNMASLEGVDTLVFHGFYYITPQQEHIMRLLEESGFKLIFLIPYDERFPYVYEIWDDTYSEERGYPPKSKWHIEKSTFDDPYGNIFEGKEATIRNDLQIKEYASIIEFVDDVKHIKQKGFSIYSSDYKAANKMLKDFFPEDYGDRKILSYPIGQFISTLNRMWDDELQTIALSEENLIECFSSGWLSVDGVAGKEYLQDLVYILPFFNGCNTIEEWEKRITLFKEIQEKVIAPFEVEFDADEAISRWQEAIGSPLKNFSMFAVPTDSLNVILTLIRQLLSMAKELFGKKDAVRIQDHVHALSLILKKHEMSNEIYPEEQEIIGSIFEQLGEMDDFNPLVHPADIARALDLFICGKFEEGEIQTDKIGLVYPLYFIDAACIKNKSKVHICMADVESLPGGNKDYVWPLTGKKIKEVYENTNNTLIINLIQIMEANTLCNRYFTYCALKNKEVTISWVSANGEKLLAPSPYIKLLQTMTGIEIEPPARYGISRNRIADTVMSPGRINAYDNDLAPENMIKEARMDYALCPMKYVLGYITESHPTYQSDFQQTYALNALISGIYNLMKDKGMTVDEVYKNVIELFPNLRKVEKRQVYDYIEYDRRENDMNYGIRTECGGKFYTDERLKIHYPNQDVREQVILRFGKLLTPDGRKGVNLYERMDEVRDACTFCQHIGYCRNALYPGDQENYYD